MAPNVDGDVFVDDVIRSDVKIDKTVMKSEEVLSLSDMIRKGFAAAK
ncbi:MAG: hypothetical protein JRN67_07210 [Nitrososphaerota archaeon]|nr:hypothetical protein [Nitrososphaerota archaeon]